MIPIEQTSQGTLLFLKCGCAALRGLTHPTGAAALVVIVRLCDEHVGYDEPVDGTLVRSLPKGEPVSPFVRAGLT